jgi:hypothetical protein
LNSEEVKRSAALEAELASARACTGSAARTAAGARARASDRIVVIKRVFDLNTAAN